MVKSIKAIMANIVVAALAGTGKTTLLVQLVRIFTDAGLSVLCLAFASRDKKSLDERTAGKSKNFTSNGAGLSILGAYARKMSSGRRDIVNDEVAGQMLITQLKADGLIKEGAGEGGKDKWEIPGQIYGFILNLTSKCRTCLALKFNDPKYPSAPDDNAVMELAERFNMELSSADLPTVLHYVKWLFHELASLKNFLVYGADMDGMVFLPVYHDLKPANTYHRVLVDEAQDQSFVNRQIALMHLMPEVGRLVIVGDPNQGIYEWRGADADSMPQWCIEMRERGGFEVFPLTLCRRCSKAVIRDAQCLVPEIQALPTAPEGSSTILKDSKELLEKLTIERKGLLLCRANAPMVSMVLKLLARRIPAALTRSDIVNGLLRLVDQASKGDRNTAIPDVLENLNNWLSDQLSKFAKQRNGATKAQLASDKWDCIVALSEEEAVKTAGDLTKKIDEIFPKNTVLDPNKMVVGSTIHGAKGGEGATVYLLSPDDAKVNIFDQIWSNARDRDNTLYVAITRCMLDIVYVGSKPAMTRFSEPIDLTTLSSVESEESDESDY